MSTAAFSLRCELPRSAASRYNARMEREQVRIQALAHAFAEAFGERPDAGRFFFARAPGRVNLIGEHTDYNGCPVLPMALERDAAALFRPRTDRIVQMANRDNSYAPISFEIARQILPFPTGHWGNYVKAGMQTAVDYAASTGADPAALCGADIVVDGTIPEAAGLSSSSAIVVLSALITLTSNGFTLEESGPSRIELAQLLAAGERYVGTQGGGMDQAASLLSREGSALKIDFNPFAVRAVPLPGGFSLVVANSMVRAPKTREAMDRYNLRTIECRLASAIVREEYIRKYKTTAKLELIGDLSPDNLRIPMEEIERLVAGALHEEPYTLAAAARALALTEEEAADRFCRRRDGSLLAAPREGFRIAQRLRHVREEWARVERSVSLLEAGDAEAFGRLMYESHESCRDLFEISCPELDELVEIARSAGAAGARLTGAGFGGCTVNLVREPEEDRFVDELRRRYHSERMHIGEAEARRAVFVCRPGGGARVLRLRPGLRTS